MIYRYLHCESHLLSPVAWIILAFILGSFTSAQLLLIEASNESRNVDSHREFTNKTDSNIILQVWKLRPQKIKNSKVC